jgi:coenzyme F420 hydrogenase subunit beta
MLELDEIVINGLCVGCGLCRSIAEPGGIRMIMTVEGRERPVATEPLPQQALETINAVCPGTRVVGANPEQLAEDAKTDLIWGPIARSTMTIAHASDPEVRYRAAAGGVLTALGQYLLHSGAVELVLHVRASTEAPIRTVATVSETPEDVLAAATSRYGPAPVLEDFLGVVGRGRPFAVIAKPCDIGAVRLMAATDGRVRDLMRYCLTLSCGGVSDFGKSTDLLAERGIAERDVTLFRYRGHGNPGPMRIEARDGRHFEVAYNEFWGDEAGWRIQPRCKICPDAVGEAADLVAADCWPGGSPVGEDEGFNAVFARTAAGKSLFERAVAAGVLTIVRQIGFPDIGLFQPHQADKKRALWARLEGMKAVGMAVPNVEGLRLEEIAATNEAGVNDREREGAMERARNGRLGEPAPVAG